MIEKLLQFLHQTGIEPGGAVRVVKRNYDQTVAIETAMGQFTIGPAAAEKVQVKRAAERGAGPARSLTALDESVGAPAARGAHPANSGKDKAPDFAALRPPCPRRGCGQGWGTRFRGKTRIRRQI